MNTKDLVGLEVEGAYRNLDRSNIFPPIPSPPAPPPLHECT